MATLDIFKETTQVEILNELKATSALVSILAKGYDIDSPAALQELCASGQIAKWLNIGDVIFIPWTDYTGNTPVEYSFPFVVAYIGDCYDENDVKHENGLWLMAMYGEPQEIIFDEAENTVVDLTTETTAQEGWYYFGHITTPLSYTKLNLNTGDPIELGSYDSIRKCGINDVNVLRYGYNRWSVSAYRQWLNSDVAKNTGWWTSQHLGDVPPAAAMVNKPGWLYGFTAEWRAVFKPVKVDTACNTVTDGGVTDTTYDTFFLPSVEQMYGAPQAPGVEGEYWPYWKEETGYAEPNNGSSGAPNDARKIPSIANPTGSAVVCRVRSALRGNSTYVWVVATAGSLSSYGAGVSYRSLPACVIY